MTLELKKRIITSVILLSFFFVMFIYKFVLLIGLLIFGSILWIEFTALMEKIIKLKKLTFLMIRFIFQFLCLVYLLIFCVIFWKSFSIEINKVFYLFILGISIVTDIGGLIFGKFFKGRKLTKISPKKTISGSIGSFIFSLILMIVFNIFSPNSYDYMSLLFLTLLVSFLSQIGDLFISYIKRNAKVKDTGDLLPGHGGFLDRFDGILFGFPFGFYISKLLNLV